MRERRRTTPLPRRVVNYRTGPAKRSPAHKRNEYCWRSCTDATREKVLPDNVYCHKRPSALPIEFRSGKLRRSSAIFNEKKIIIIKLHGTLFFVCLSRANAFAKAMVFVHRVRPPPIPARRSTESTIYLFRNFRGRFRIVKLAITTAIFYAEIGGAPP